MNSTESRVRPRRTGRNQELGALGEALAADYLEEQGALTLDRGHGVTGGYAAMGSVAEVLAS